MKTVQCKPPSDCKKDFLFIMIMPHEDIPRHYTGQVKVRDTAQNTENS